MHGLLFNSRKQFYRRSLQVESKALPTPRSLNNVEDEEPGRQADPGEVELKGLSTFFG